MLDWLKNGDEHHSDPSMRTPASASALLAALRGADPVAALEELTGWLGKDLPAGNGKARSEILARVHESGGAHVGALLTQYLAAPGGASRKDDASSWDTLSRYLMVLAHAHYGSARTPLKSPDSSQSIRLVAAADAARCIQTCRTLTKACLIRYLGVPAKLWRMAYSVHDKAEKAGCAATPVHLRASDTSTTTVTQELLRLLMLHSCAPEMMAPRQIEIADRVTEQLGHDFTLRPVGVADNPFCFDPASELPPQRSPGANGATRYFGAGAGLTALEKLHRQLAAAKVEEVKAFGKDIDPYTQLSATRHLLAFWAQTCPYTPPARSAATGALRVIQGYSQAWQQLSRSRSVTAELTLAEDDDGPVAAPQTWVLRDTGGNELGADIPPDSKSWPRCGNLVAVSRDGSDDYWVGVIRSMHARRDGSLHATIAVLSREPVAVELRTLYEQHEDNAFSAEAAREFAFNRASAILLADGSAESHTPNLLLPAESWKEGRVYEVSVNGSTRRLRGMQLLRRGDDYARVTFEWVELAESVV
ncbi:MAG TPA: hypothetical protein VH600_19175 [Burkholderiales bacterium]